MKELLNNIRKSESNMKLKNKIINSVIILVIGILLGMFSKWLDNLSIDNNIWWHNIIGKLDLNNFFSDMAIWLAIALAISVYSKTPLRAAINVLLFFIGMNTSYHLYTIMFSGFNPRSYMQIWYTLTIISPFIGYICWYAKSNHIIGSIISSIILFVMYSSCFNIGMVYFDMKGILYSLTFIASIIILYKNPRNTVISLIVGLIPAFFIRIPFISG